MTLEMLALVGLLALLALLVCGAIGIAVWSVSLVVEAVRPVPRAPTTLLWAPQIPIRSVEVGGVPLGCTTARQVAPLVLLQTLRTQLDLFAPVRKGRAAPGALLLGRVTPGEKDRSG